MYRIEALEMIPVSLRLKQTFKTAHSTTKNRPLTLVKLTVSHSATGKKTIGLGEIQSFADFSYTLENQSASREIVNTMINPVIQNATFESPQKFAEKLERLTPFGSFAKAGVEMAAWDAVGKLTNRSLAQMIGGTRQRVPVGTVLDLNADISDIKRAIDKGYQRIKMKIDAQSLDKQKLIARLNQFPNQQFSLDANSSFSAQTAEFFNQLPENVAFIEQPFSENDFVNHAFLQKNTPHFLSLDESINSLDDINTMIALHAAKAITIKQAKIGGITAALKAIQLASRAGIKPWIGGMLSSNLGRAVDLAMASLPNITFAGDISESSHYFEHDITVETFEITEGLMTVPTQNGLGVTLDDSFDVL